MSKFVRILMLLVALPAAFLAVTQFTQQRETAALDLQGITAERMAAHVALLGHDLLEGRAPATRGGELAAAYLSTQFALLGLEPAGDHGTFLQAVPIVASTINTDRVTFRARGPQGMRKFVHGRDLVINASVEAPAVSLDADVVFVGHGIVAPEFSWDDYASLDVMGKIVMVMVNDPPATEAEPDLFDGDALTYYGRWTYKYEEAARQGAAGAILIHTDVSATYPFQVVLASALGTQAFLPPDDRAPGLLLKSWMTEDAATALAAVGGHDLLALRRDALVRRTGSRALGIALSVAYTQQTTRQTSPNVVGRLTGRTAGEAVVFTAHYDHLGSREMPDGGDGIFNGARDNASGVAAMLEVAGVYTRAADEPGRSVYFVATAAEERGLLGSEYFVRHPPIPVDQMAANLNLDSMNVYGSSESLVLLGAERSSLGALVTEVARQSDRVVGSDAHPERGSFFRSDHFSFARAGVPALSLASGDPSGYRGPNADTARSLAAEYNARHYHQPSDEVSAEWDWTGAVEDARLMADLGWRVAADPRMPSYHRGDQFAAPRGKGTQP